MNPSVRLLTGQPVAVLSSILLTSAAWCSGPAFAEPQQIGVKGGVSIYSVPAREQQSTRVNDIALATPMPLPMVTLHPIAPMLLEPTTQGLAACDLSGTPGFVEGKSGTGAVSNALAPLEMLSVWDGALDSALDGEINPEAFGTSRQPFTTARVDTAGNNVSRTYPFSAAGKLYFRDRGQGYVCSASLIKRGVIVTAAHCVAAFGENRYYTNFQFVPAKYNNRAPFGVWNGAAAFVLSSVLKGTDGCGPGYEGVVCQNDVAVIRLAPKSGKFPGTKTGWLGYAWNGYGLTPDHLTLINQLGYPVSHDSGYIMQRTDSQGSISGRDFACNTVWGSGQSGGSSGGPQVMNLGIRGRVSLGLGQASTPNLVIGTTSWGYSGGQVLLQGASPFLSTNIVPLVDQACSGANNAACR